MHIEPLFFVPGAGMVGVAIFPIIYWRRKTLSPWVFFLWGALAWFVAITLKVGFSVVLNKPVIQFFQNAFSSDIVSPITWIYIGLLTGIFECGIVLLFALRRSIKEAIWKNVVAFGIGFGTIEALFLGLGSLIGLLLAILMPDKLPSQVLTQLQAPGLKLLTIPAPIIERAAAILLHTFSCILIIYALRMRKWGWFWLSFIYKTGIDSVVAYGQLSYDFNNPFYLWIFESIIVIFGFLGIWGIYYFRRKYCILERIS